MLDKYQKLKDEFDTADKKFTKTIDDMNAVIEEMQEKSSQQLEDLKNVNIIIKDIDKNFAEKTGIINPKDQVFLWIAVGMQCVRWILIPTIDEDALNPSKEGRKDSASEGKKDKTKTSKQLDNTREEREQRRYINCYDIMALPVSYDAMKGTEDIYIPGVTELGVNIYSMNHHSATLGHDPIVGLVVGPANIMTRTITFHDAKATTRRVINPSGRKQEVVHPNILHSTVFKEVLESSREDIKRIPTALTKELLHLESDKYTKTGLPIPLLPAELQQKLLDNLWNSEELKELLGSSIKGASINYIIAVIINYIVGLIHGLFYNEMEDENKSLYSVRTRKIIATSNVIAESINLAAVTAGTIGGYFSDDAELIKKSISHLDIGGMVEAIHQVGKSKKLQEELRRQFLEQELEAKLLGDKYSFLEESYYG